MLKHVECIADNDLQINTVACHHIFQGVLPIFAGFTVPFVSERRKAWASVFIAFEL